MYYIKINKLIEDSKQKDYFSKNDLYVKINYIEDNKVKSRKSQTIYNNNKPIWNEIFLLENVTDLEVILYEKGKFMDRLIDSKKISLNLKELIKENIINIEIIHGEVLLEDKKLKNKIINNKNTIKELNNNIIKKKLEIKNLNLNNISLKQDIILKKNIIKKIEKLIINI